METTDVNAADLLVDQLEQVVMRDPVLRRRMQKIWLASLASIREDHGDLYGAWLELVAEAQRDIRKQGEPHPGRD